MEVYHRRYAPWPLVLHFIDRSRLTSTLCFFHKKTSQYICHHNSGKSRRILISGNGNECLPHTVFIYFTCDVNMTSLSHSWHWWALSCCVCCMCGENWSSRWLMTQLTNGQHACMLVFMPMVDILTYLVTVSLFSLYLMNFMFHTTLHAVSNILRVHCKSTKCDVSFSQGSVSTLFWWGEHVFIYTTLFAI